MEEEAWINQGIKQYEARDFEGAIASYDQAIKIKPDDYEACYNRGIAAVNSVSCDLLLAWLSPIARQNPHLNQHGCEEALASYEEGLKYSFFLNVSAPPILVLKKL